MRSRITKLSLLILGFIMISSSFAMANSLSDIDESQYKYEIKALMEKEVIHGYTDGTFKPKANISRGEFAKILRVALDLKVDPEGASHFLDVEGKWYQGEIGAIFKEGLMIGVADEKFSPDSNITKEELAVILIRAFDLEYALEDLEVISDIADIKNLPNWSKKSVFLAEAIGLMKAADTEDGVMFLPKDLGNREEVSKLVYELLFNKGNYEDSIKDVINLPKVEETEEVKKEEAKKEEPKKETPKKETPKKEEPKPEAEKIDMKKNVLGTWKTSYGGISADMTFYEDNTCYVEASIASATGTYSISGDSMSVSLMGRQTSGEMVVEGKDKFSIISSSGNSMVFTRK